MKIGDKKKKEDYSPHYLQTFLNTMSKKIE